MKKIKQIIEGWSKLAYDKLVGLPPETQELAAERLAICNACPVRTGNRCDPKKAGNHVETHEQKSGCGCIISAKVVSGSPCPLGKW